MDKIKISFKKIDKSLVECAQAVFLLAGTFGVIFGFVIIVFGIPIVLSVELFSQNWIFVLQLCLVEIVGIYLIRALMSILSLVQNSFDEKSPIRGLDYLND